MVAEGGLQTIVVQVCGDGLRNGSRKDELLLVNVSVVIGLD